MILLKREYIIIDNQFIYETKIHLRKEISIVESRNNII